MNTLSSYIPEGAKFVCEGCPCGELRLLPMGDYCIAECDHIVQVLRDGQCVEIHSLGTRQ